MKLLLFAAVLLVGLAVSAADFNSQFKTASEPLKEMYERTIIGKTVDVPTFKAFCKELINTMEPIMKQVTSLFDLDQESIMIVQEVNVCRQAMKKTDSEVMESWRDFRLDFNYIFAN